MTRRAARVRSAYAPTSGTPCFETTDSSTTTHLRLISLAWNAAARSERAAQSSRWSIHHAEPLVPAPTRHGHRTALQRHVGLTGDQVAHVRWRRAAAFPDNGPRRLRTRRQATLRLAGPRPDARRHGLARRPRAARPPHASALGSQDSRVGALDDRSVPPAGTAQAARTPLRNHGGRSHRAEGIGQLGVLRDAVRFRTAASSPFRVASRISATIVS